MGDTARITEFKLSWSRTPENPDNVNNGSLEKDKVKKLIDAALALEDIPDSLIIELQKLLPAVNQLSACEQDFLEACIQGTDLAFAGVQVSAYGFEFKSQGSCKLYHVEEELTKILRRSRQDFVLNGEIIVMSDEEVDYSQKFVIKDSQLTTLTPQGILWG